ncbi:hypothetical protein GCM10007874_38200 [Labrys miyagiensis]|uniref:Uncharacterized protein n=1 Tax=Labrys miyagiensis TaxID=346912 RepID=A0ABQ6CKI3_9HYPH|nr:hypothetical protein [Labrys miyagiensis]GLS20803.1 hypothetical protein GCM10007874_38200 [Labrys miyagiensis]
MPQTEFDNNVRHHILVCLTNPDAVAAVNQILTTCGFAVTTTYEFSQFVEAATLDRYRAVVTATAMIDRIREASTLPVLNIEAFTFQKSDYAGSAADGRCLLSGALAQCMIDLLEDTEGVERNNALR